MDAIKIELVRLSKQYYISTVKYEGLDNDEIITKLLLLETF